MKKKNVLIWVTIITTIVLFVCFVFWFLWNGVGGTTNQPVDLGSFGNSTALGNGSECIIWQSDDSSKPCFRVVEIRATSTQVSLPAVVSKCNGLSVIEADECISSIAIETKSKDLCDVLTSVEARKACLGSYVLDSIDRKLVDVKIPPIAPVVPTSTQDFLSQTNTVDMGSFLQGEIAKQVGKYQEAVANPDPRYTADGFYDRMSEKATLSLFQVSPYQVKPGGLVTVKGAGFQPQNNVLYIGDVASLGAESGDGMSFTTTIPLSVSEGSYDVYVKNSRGSTLSSVRPIRIVVTNNPKPLPKITSVEPLVATPNGTIVVRGDHMFNLEGLYTSLGWVEGSSNSINLKSLQYMKNFTSSPHIKTGSKLQFAIYAKTDAGISEEPFFFEVQF